VTDLRVRLQPALADRYALEREIGQGGMATVFLAHDIRHDRRVALKVLRPELAVALGAERFQREIHFTARLDHPNVLQVLDSGEAAGLLWCSIPFVDGGSLRARLLRETQLAIPEAVRIACAVALALEHAHRKGVVHRDIKPENILLSGDRVLVADFGIARLLDGDAAARLTETGLSLGTPVYMSPEQAAGDRGVDGRTDLYALGCVLYEMLMGQPPFTGPTARAILAQHAIAAVPSLRSARSTIPPALEAAIAKSLAKVPADRFDTMAAFAAALVVEPGAAEVATDSDQGARGWKRRRGLRTGAALVCIAVSVGAAWLLPRAGRAVVAPAASAMAVMPFAPPGVDTALTRLGRDLATTVSANLDGVGNIRVVDRLTILAQTEKHRGGLALSDAAALGRRYGATSVLAGSLVRDGTRVRLDVGLYSTDSLHPLARAVVTGSPDSVSALTDSVTWRVLDGVWRQGTAPTPTLEAITTRSVDALRAFLDGEELSTAGRLAEAGEAYDRAIAADSSFWYAYFRAVNIAGWAHTEVSPAYVKAYREHRGMLPDRERLLIEAVDLDSGGVWERSRLEALVQQHPDYWPAWFLLGDRYVHEYPYLGSTRSDARQSLERAVALSPRLVLAWAHLVLVYQADRDTAAASRALDTLKQLGAAESFRREGRDLLLHFRTVHALQTGSPATPALLDSLYESGVRIMAAGGELPFEYVTGLAAASPAAQVAFNKRLLRALLPPAAADLVRGLVSLNWAARGAWDSALATMRLAGTSPESPLELDAYRLAVLGAWLGAIPGDRALQHRPTAVARRSLDSTRVAELAWLDGVLAVTRQDQGGVAMARAAMVGASPVDVALFDPALASGVPAMGERLAALELESASDDPWLPLATIRLRRALNRMTAVPLLLAAGDTARALELLTWYQAESGPRTEKIVVAPFAYLALARIEEARGQRRQARQNYEQFLVRYDMAPEIHRPLVAAAHAAVARLSE